MNAWTISEVQSESFCFCQQVTHAKYLDSIFRLPDFFSTSALADQGYEFSSFLILELLPTQSEVQFFFTHETIDDRRGN